MNKTSQKYIAVMGKKGTRLYAIVDKDNKNGDYAEEFNKSYLKVVPEQLQKHLDSLDFQIEVDRELEDDPHSKWRLLEKFAIMWLNPKTRKLAELLYL